MRGRDEVSAQADEALAEQGCREAPYAGQGYGQGQTGEERLSWSKARRVMADYGDSWDGQTLTTNWKTTKAANLPGSSTPSKPLGRGWNKKDQKEKPTWVFDAINAANIPPKR